MSDSNPASLLTVGEMIERAFADPCFGRIDFKLIETILYILARKLQILNRQIILDLALPSKTSEGIEVSEIKLQVKQEKKPRQKLDELARVEADTRVINSKKTSKVEEETSDSSLETLPGEDKDKNKKKLTHTKTTDSNPDSDRSKLKKYDVMVHLTASEGFASKGFRRKITSDLQKLPTIQSVSESNDPDSSSKRGPLMQQDSTLESDKYFKLLERIEEQREKVLRVIQQRTNSLEEWTTPSPIASLDSTEIQFEKLLVVQRVSGGDKRNYGPTTDLSRPKSLVTQEQYKELRQQIFDLQKRLDQSTIVVSPIKEIHYVTALQISKRLKLAEKLIVNLTSVVADIATDSKSNVQEKAKVLQKETNILARLVEKIEQANPDDETHYGLYSPSTSEIFAHGPPTVHVENVDYITPGSGIITRKQLIEELEKHSAYVLEAMEAAIAKNNEATEMVFKQAKELEAKIGDAAILAHRYKTLEKTVANYAQQVVNLDSGITSQVNNALEQVTKMQFELQEGIDHMTDAVTERAIDPELLQSLNANFVNVQNNIENTVHIQKELSELQEKMRQDMEFLKIEQEMLRDSKADRDEVIDALHDKAGIKDFNGTVSIEQQKAIVTHFENKIKDAYNKFNKQEIQWQKAIDRTLELLNDKVDVLQIESLRDDINRHLNKLKDKIDTMKDILGEPLSATVTRRIYRDTACLSCNNPAHIVPPPERVVLERTPPSEGTKPLKVIEETNQVCIPGMKIQHPIDTRATMCTRYCGGEHTKIPNIKPSILVRPLKKWDNSAGKEDEKVAKPCVPCNTYKIQSNEQPKEGQMLVGSVSPAIETAKSNEAKTVHDG